MSISRQLTICAFAASSMMLAGCNTQLGIAPGVLDGSSTSAFNGITAVTILSPTSATISWNASSRYSSYKVFQGGATAPLASSLFSSVTVNGLTPDTSYTFSVGGISTEGGSPFGTDATLTAQTWPTFTGISSVVATSSSTLRVTWSFPAAGPTYKVYVNQGSIPTDFSTPDATVQGLSTIVSTWGGSNPIQQSVTYYVVVRASYPDATSERNLNALSVTTPSAISPLPTISAPSVILGTTPTIGVSGGLAGYKTTFSIGTNVLGSINGNGNFIAPTSKPLSAGKNVITPVVTYQGNSVTLPTFTITSRSVSSITNDAPLLFGGKGRQNMGAALTVGDFNCDGTDDLAVSAPLGTFFNAPYVGNSAQESIMNGGVYVFFGGGPQGLILPGQVISGRTIPAPSVNPGPGDPLFIPFPNSLFSDFYTTSYAAGTIGNMFGYSLAAGNINGDTQTISTNTYACDDLVIGSPTIVPYNPAPYFVGAVFVYYGSPSGLQTGDPIVNAPACSGSICSPQEITPVASAGDPALTTGAGGTVEFGSALALGNFDGNASGYHGLAVSAPYYAGDATYGAQTQPGKVFIYKADSTGITFGAAVDGYAASTIIAPNTVSLPLSFYGPNPILGSFGLALAAVDIDGDGFDDLFVGSPQDTETVLGTPTIQRGSVYYYHNTHAAGVGFVNQPAPDMQLQSGLSGFTGPYADTDTFWGGALINAGDLNGDGYPDLVVANGFGYSFFAGFTAPGIVTVIYGSATGPQGFSGTIPAQPSSPAINTTACNTGCGATTCTVCKVQQFYGGPGGVSWLTSNWGGYPSGTGIWGTTLAGAKTQNNPGLGFLPFGGQMLNGDAYSDVLVGNSAGGTYYSGTGIALYGSKNGVQPVHTVINPTQASANDATGLGVAIGLFKSQPICPTVATAAVGAPNNSTLGNGPFGGVVYTFMPQAAGGICTMASNVSNPTQLVKANLSAEGTPAQGVSGTTFYASPAGDINNDGYTDLVVSMSIPPVVPGSSSAFSRFTGDPYYNIWVNIVYYGGPNGISLDTTAVTRPGTSNMPSINPVGKQPLLIVPPSTSQCGGTGQLACYITVIGVLTPAGDVNGDGFADLIGWNMNRQTVLYFGSASGLQVAKFPQTSATGLDAKLLGTFYWSGTEYPLHHYTYGDFNGDGYSDVAYGSYSWADFPNSVAGQGTVIVAYGGPSGLQTVDGLIAGCTGAAYNGLGTKTWPNGNTTYMCGKNASGTVPNTALANPCDGSTPGACVVQQLVPPAPEDSGAYFGDTISAVGDINGDGFEDLVVSAPYDSSFNGVASAGIIYVYFGSSRGLAVSNDGHSAIATPTSPTVYSPAMVNPPGATPSRAIGSQGGVAAAGDVNKDGYADFLINDAMEAQVAGVGGGAFLFYGCQANVAGCPNTGIWGVTFDTAGQTFSTAATLGGGCTAGQQTCAVLNAASCVAGGACSPLFFVPPIYDNGYNGNSYWGAGGLGTVGDVNGDGYADVLIGNGFPGTSNGPTFTSSAGYSMPSWGPGHAVLYSGSSTGLTIGIPNRQPQCLQGQGCVPYEIQPPMTDWGALGGSEVVNLTYMQSMTGFGTRKPADFNGDGLPDFFMTYGTYWNAKQNGFFMGGLLFFQ